MPPFPIYLGIARPPWPDPWPPEGPNPWTRRGSYPPELQAFLHDRVGREEDQEPMRHHTGDVAWRYMTGQGKCWASADLAWLWDQGLSILVLVGPRLPRKDRILCRAHSPRVLPREDKHSSENLHKDRVVFATCPTAQPQVPPACPLGPKTRSSHRLSNAELSSAPSGPLGTTPTQSWCFSMTCGFSRQTGKGLGQTMGGP